jgi:hypothetical protein
MRITLKNSKKIPADLIEKGEESLHALLPRESERKFVDLSQLSLIWPYGVVTDEERQHILENVEYHLLRERGVIRYKGDRYYNKNEDGVSEEAEWTFGLSWLAIIYETKGQEKIYQQMLKDREKDAARIRAELFALSGSAAISFERALDLAKRAGAKTGVRPAFILGIIAEESNLGQNVGKGNWKVDMHPTRDVPIFKEITAELGLDPDQMPVSKKVWYGYGGAMGPAQFIPSTWVGFKSRISALTGNNPPNPWDPEDAFMAAALYSKDNGADKQTYNAEFRAAMCYLAGCKNASKASLQFYGEDVMDLAAKYQKQIDILGG